MNKKIIKIQPLENTISFIIHLNNKCNFKCTYCTAWHQTSWDALTMEDFNNIKESIYKLRERGDTRNIQIDLTWWEPTLDKDLIKIVNSFLDIDNLYVQVTTNLFNILSFREDLINLKDKKRVNFNISYHYFENIWKEDNFIEWTKLLKIFNIPFEIKFLLPNKWMSLDDFLIVKDRILLESNITEENLKYDLIINTKWQVYDDYSNDMLNYYENKDDLILDYNVRDWWLMVTFDDNSTSQLDFSEIRSKWLNKFKWLDCYYIWKESVEISISHKWYVTFWPCFTLDKMRYSTFDLSELLLKERKIICADNYCDCWINLKKKSNVNYEKYTELENILKNNLVKYLPLFKIDEISISLWKNIKISLLLNDLIVYFYIEKQVWDKYILIKEWIGYSFTIKDIDNRVVNFNSISKEYGSLINKSLYIISKFDNIYKQLILKNEI